MKLTLRSFRQYALTCLPAIFCVSSPVLAGGLQIAPVSLTLQATQNADGIWLSNEGGTPLNAQVRVWSWTQSDYSDKLTSARGWLSVPDAGAAPRRKQLVRVIRTGSTTRNVEEAWRLSIDELPRESARKIRSSSLCATPFRFCSAHGTYLGKS